MRRDEGANHGSRVQVKPQEGGEHSKERVRREMKERTTARHDRKLGRKRHAKIRRIYVRPQEGEHSKERIRR